MICCARKHALPKMGELAQVVFQEVAQESLAHAVEMGGARPRQERLARVGQHRVAAAAVGRARVALQQAVALEPVDQPRHAGAREQHAVGQLGHPAAPVWGGLQIDQHLVGAEGQVVLGEQLGVERLHERAVDAEHAAPRPKLEPRQLANTRFRMSRHSAASVASGRCANNLRISYARVKLEGLHHVTAITADARRNLEFYATVLGLRFVKKTVNYDAPDVYHLYYGDEQGTPGSIMTFFEFPGARQGRPGSGMVHTVAWRVATREALDFWGTRLDHAGRPVERAHGVLRSSDPEGLAIEIVASSAPDAPLAAAAPEIPAEHALLGFDGVRAYARDPSRPHPLLDRLGFAHGVLAGEQRRARYAYDPAPAEPGIQGAGTVHHVAWAARDEGHEAWPEVPR